MAEPMLIPPDWPRVTGKQVRYPEQILHYAKLYGSSERTVKRWVAVGRDVEPPDYAPLHRPELMPEWWGRRMGGQKCPDRILRASRKVEVKPVEAPPVEPSHSPVIEISPPLPISGTLDMESSVEQLRRSLAQCHALLVAAQLRVPVDEGEVAARQRVYQSTFSEVRKAELDLQEWQAARALTAPRAEVRAENNRIAASIYQAVLRLVKNARPRLANKSPAEQDKIWHEATLECFAVLKKAKFTDAIE